MSATDVLILLLKQAIKATREVAQNAKIIIHVRLCPAILSLNLQNAQTDYDDFSRHPGGMVRDLNALEQNIKTITTTFKKPVLIAETAYPFCFPAYNDYTNNIAGSDRKPLMLTPAHPLVRCNSITPGWCCKKISYQ